MPRRPPLRRRLRKPTLYTFGEPELSALDDRTAHILRMRSGMWDGRLENSPCERQQLRLLRPSGEEIAGIKGILTGPSWVAAKGEKVVELFVGQGGLSARVKIPLDPQTRCTISPDGILTGTLPGGATWIAAPLESGEP